MTKANVKINNRFPELEGLRAYFALTVVVGHIFEFMPYKLPGPIKTVLSPGYPVQNFMVLRGFVITHLLIVKQEAYSAYLTRRAARLLPIYILILDDRMAHISAIN
jgi:peptidoglycan/LPS O-acetylase OafA/YrhL